MHGRTTTLYISAQIFFEIKENYHEKKLFALITIAALMLAMAVPCFAAQVGIPTTFYGGNGYVTVAATQPANSAGVFSSGDFGDRSRWYLLQGGDGFYRLYTALAPYIGGYSMNRHNNGFSCILWHDLTDTASQRDSIVDLLTCGLNQQYISLERASGNKYLESSYGSVSWYTSGTVYTVNP